MRKKNFFYVQLGVAFVGLFFFFYGISIKPRNPRVVENRRLPCTTVQQLWQAYLYTPFSIPFLICALYDCFLTIQKLSLIKYFRYSMFAHSLDFSDRNRQLSGCMKTVPISLIPRPPIALGLCKFSDEPRYKCLPWSLNPHQKSRCTPLSSSVTTFGSRTVAMKAGLMREWS